MSYKTLLVHLELNGDNDGVLKIAGELAARFQARVIGIAAAQPIRILYDEGWTSGEVINRDREDLNRDLAACEAQFRGALQGSTQDIAWRSAITFAPLADYIAEQACGADLIVTGKEIGGSLLDDNRRVHMGDLVMQAGRPILLVPRGISTLPMRHAFVAWKESRESRRAVMDALPLLEVAGEVGVLEITSQQDCPYALARVQDVAMWLQQHKISAAPLVVSAKGNEVGCLHAELLNRKCDLLVAGAYGHNRLGEWIFGGVTQDLLLSPDFCVLISH